MAESLKNRVEQRMRALLRELRELQEEHRAMTGRYWQGLRTHSTPPRDGQAAPIDRRASKATDQSDDWDGFGLTLPPDLDCALQVDSYSGPNGDGYTVTASIEIAGEVWTRTANVGPESWRASGWSKSEKFGDAQGAVSSVTQSGAPVLEKPKPSRS